MGRAHGGGDVSLSRGRHYGTRAYLWAGDREPGLLVMPMALPTQRRISRVPSRLLGRKGRESMPLWEPGGQVVSQAPTAVAVQCCCPLQLLCRLLQGLHGLLHVDNELRGLAALRVHGHCLDALHVIGGHHQMVLLSQLHGGLLEGLLDHDGVVGAGLLIGDLEGGKRELMGLAFPARG